MIDLYIILDWSGSMKESDKYFAESYLLRTAEYLLHTERYGDFRMQRLFWNEQVSSQQGGGPSGSAVTEVLAEFMREHPGRYLLASDGSFEYGACLHMPEARVLPVAVGLDADSKSLQRISSFSHQVCSPEELPAALNLLCFGGAGV